MRGCLGFLLFTTAAIAALAFFLVRTVLPMAVTAAVESSPLLRGQPVSVSVETSVAGIVRGQVDRIVISGHDLVESDAAVASLELTLTDVSILDRTYRSASGRLTGVTIEVGSPAPIGIQSVELSGTAGTILATVNLDATAAISAIEARLRAAGVPVVQVSLASGRVDLTAAGLTVPAQVVVAGGGLQLSLGAPFGSVPLLTAPAGGEWRLDEVVVSPSGIRLVVFINAR